jgi:uncharacterized membrane protein YqiK
LIFCILIQIIPQWLLTAIKNSKNIGSVKLYTQKGLKKPEINQDPFSTGFRHLAENLKSAYFF